jgi:hypothetical protein
MSVQNLIYVIGKSTQTQSSIVYSDDGVTWNNITPDPFEGTKDGCKDIVTNGTVVVTGGDTIGTTTVYYSLDGLYFQPVTVHGIEGVTDLFSSGFCNRLYYANSLFVACGNNGVNDTYTLAYSSNGIDWYPSTTGGNSDPFLGGNPPNAYNVYFANNLWIAVGEGTTCYVASSSNGQIWNQIIDAGVFYGRGLSVSYDGGNWVIVSINGDADIQIGYSSDGVSWYSGTTTSTFINYNNQYGIYYGSNGAGGNIWNIVGNKGVGSNKTIEYTTNLSNWIDVTLDPFTDIGVSQSIANSIYYANNYWVAVGTNNLGAISTNTIAYSTDGQTWNLVSDSNTDPFVPGTGLVITYNQYYSMWIAGGSNGLATATTPVGPWTLVPLFELFPFNKIVSIRLGPPPCFLESSTILTDDGYIPIENIKPGTLVKTFQEGFKRVQYIGSSIISNPESTDRIQKRLYILTKEKYPELTEDLILTGDHSILVKSLTDNQRELINKNVGRVFVTSNRYRLMSFADEKAEPWSKKGDFKVWHLALENTQDNTNYGIYANGGLLVESAAIKALKDREGMTLV